jgi:hypothetical protein
MRVTILQTADKKMVHHFGTTKYSGCQCFGDCYCKEDFKPTRFSYFTVVRRIGTKKQKTTIHPTLCSANERWDFINTLTLNPTIK